MREIKSEMGIAKKQHDIIVLKDIPKHHSLIVANRFLLLLASSLMLVIFILGFFIFPTDDPLDRIEASSQNKIDMTSSMANPALSDEINTLKSQLVGLISGSIESKLDSLEKSIRTGSTITSLNTIQNLKNEVRILKTYSEPEKTASNSQMNEALLKEVSQLKTLVYLTLTSCGLMVAAISGFLIRKHYRLNHPRSLHKLAGK